MELTVLIQSNYSVNFKKAYFSDSERNAKIVRRSKFFEVSLTKLNSSCVFYLC